MALAAVFSCALPGPSFVNQGSAPSLKQDLAAFPVPVSVPVPVPPTSKSSFAKKWVPSRPPDQRLGSSLADYKSLSADVLRQGNDAKQSVQLEQCTRLVEQCTKLVDRLAAEGHLVEMADVIAMLVGAGVDRLSFTAVVERADVQSAIRATLHKGRLDTFVEFVHRLHTAGFVPVRLVQTNAVALLPRECRNLLQLCELDRCVRLLTTLSGEPLNYSAFECEG